jgi:broad specificity phosphatase PhoE
MAMEKQWYIIRHGETEPNRLQIIQGSGLDAPLNETGRRQALDFYSAYKHIPFDSIYTSALIRTHQSVGPFLEKGIPHISLPALNEISWGDKDGTRIEPHEQSIYNTMVRDWKAGLLDRAFDNGESPNMVAKRLRPAISELMQRPDKISLVCIHGRTLRILLCLLTEKPVSEMESFLHTNLSLYLLSYKNGKWQVDLNNDTSHLRR